MWRSMTLPVQRLGYALRGPAGRLPFLRLPHKSAASVTWFHAGTGLKIWCSVTVPWAQCNCTFTSWVDAGAQTTTVSNSRRTI